MKLENWISDRLRALEPPASWQPDAERAMARFRSRRERKAAGGKRWVWAAGGVSLAALILVALPTRGTCAQSVLGLKCAAPAVVAHLPKAAAPSPIFKYKESGSPSAPILCEIYFDYECPACADFYLHTFPLLVEKYVKTGRVKLLHRDFPLPQHPYAKLAARFANAAGELGFYDLAVGRLFRTQPVWQSTGAIAAQLAQVLPPGAMLRIERMVGTDLTLDNTLAADFAMARADAIDQTPTLVLVYGGKREKVTPAGSFALLQRYLDQLPVN